MKTNKPTHTPGPWTYESLISPKNEGKLVIKNGAEYIATVDAVEGDEKNTANGRLIAAAPETAAERDRLKEVNAELLAALKKIVAENPCVRRIGCPECAARAAIAKAGVR